MVFELHCSYRGHSYHATLSSENPTLGELGQHLAETTGVSYDTIKIVVPKTNAPVVPYKYASTTVADAGKLTAQQRPIHWSDASRRHTKLLVKCDTIACSCDH
jgi:hypothetical protein